MDVDQMAEAIAKSLAEDGYIDLERRDGIAYLKGDRVSAASHDIRGLAESLLKFVGPTIDGPEIHGMIQLRLSVFDKDRGWLTSRSGMVRGGRHPEAPMIEMPIDELLALLVMDLKASTRAVKARWERPG